MKLNDLCIICSSPRLSIFAEYTALKRVTSDCKPWHAGGTLCVCKDCDSVQKVINDAWLSDINRIYADYEVYHQAAGEEQAVFDDRTGAPTKRSQQIIKFITDSGYFKQVDGHVLDYGCANGEFLSAFSQIYKNAELFGFDLSKKYQSTLESINNFKQLFVERIDSTKEFSLVSLIHTLEHLLDPIEDLKKLKKYLCKEGLLFIQVPNLLENPFDLLLADHLLHFTPGTLIDTLARAGFEVKALSTDAVSKELSVIAVPNDAAYALVAGHASSDNKLIIDAHLKLINKILAEVDILSKQGEFAIFGTAVSGTWLYSYHEDIACFIDEDPHRIGRHYFGKKICSISQVSANMPIYIPLSGKIVTRIKKRFAGQGVNLISPYDGEEERWV